MKILEQKFNISNAGVISPYSLYEEEFATFGEDGVYNQTDSQGFVNLYSLGTKINTIMKDRI